MTTLDEWWTIEMDKHPFVQWDTTHAHKLGAPTWNGKLRTLEDMRRTRICTMVDRVGFPAVEVRCSSYGRSFESWDLIVWRDHPAHASVPEKDGWSRCPTCNERIEREQKVRDEAIAKQRDYAGQHRDELREQASIPEHYQDKTFGTWRSDTPQQKQACEAAWFYADRFKQQARKLGRCMLLTGNMGTGKTHLACAIAHELVARGNSVRFTTATEMLDRIRATYDSKNRTETKHAALSAFADVDLLIVDELGMSWGTDSEKLELFAIFNSRYNTRRPTLICTNAAPEEVRTMLGERIYDRLTEQGCDLIRFDWDSRRSS
jgi:DNA replication protein DnaC